MVSEVKDSENLETRTSKLPEQMKDVSFTPRSQSSVWLLNSPDGYGISCSSVSDELEDCSMDEPLSSLDLEFITSQETLASINRGPGTVCLLGLKPIHFHSSPASFPRRALGER